MSAAFETVAALVRARAGIVLGADKAYMLDTRLGGLMRAEGIASLDVLAAKLRAPGSERLAAAVTEALTTNESFFFRDGKPFEHLKRVLPRIVAARGAGQRLRVLSAACSTGQEAYSVAMVADSLGLLPRLEVLGTDLSGEVVRRGAGRPPLCKEAARAVAEGYQAAAWAAGVSSARRAAALRIGAAEGSRST